MLREREDGERQVLPFAVPPSRRAVRPAERRDGFGTILIFTGVRYSRVDGEDSVPAVPAQIAGEGNITGESRIGN